MRRFGILSLVVFLALPALAGTINFDEIPPANSNWIFLSDEYAHLGVHIVATDDGTIWSGLTDEDPGGWQLEGTNGSAFAGFNGRSFSMTLLFDEAVDGFRLDVARSAGSSESAGFTLLGFLAGAEVEEVFVDLGAMAINQWATAALTQPVDEVQFIGSGGHEPFGIDNLRWGGDSDSGSAQAVEIDVKPGSGDVVNPFSRGVVPVLLLGDEGFDVERVIVDSLAFGPGGAPVANNHDPEVSDVNDDGHPDLICLHSVPETGIALGDVEACLTGETADGLVFEGCGPIRTTPAAAGRATGKAHGRKR